MNTAIAKAGYAGKVLKFLNFFLTSRIQITIGMDVAASEFFKDGKYDLDFKNPNSDSSKWLTGEQLAELYQSFCKEYPVVSIEDAFDQDDWENWGKFMVSINLIKTLTSC